MVNKESKKSPENYSKERKIEILYNEVKDAFLEDFLNSINDEEIKNRIEIMFSKSLVSFNSTYGRVKDKFKYTHRDDGKRYLEHVVGVFQIYTNTFSHVKDELKGLDINGNNEDLKSAIQIINNEIDRVLIALDHDTIEDTDITFEALQQIHGNEIALSVMLISKPPFVDFINNKDDVSEIDFLREKGILNSKGLLSDKIKSKLYIEEQGEKLTEVEKILIYKSPNYSISDEERDYLIRYDKIKEKYKKKRNDFYFKNMKSYESMLEYSKTLNEKYKLGLNDIQLNRVTRNSIYIKISDRINNLSDIVIAWAYQPERIERKLQETEEKLYPIAKKLNTKAYQILKEKVKETRLELKNMINKNTIKLIQNQSIIVKKTIG